MEDTERKERLRSPNYPVFGLKTAIDRADALYKRDGKAAMHTAAAVKAWGYSTINGRSLGVLAAMRQYGLLEDTGPKMVRLSQGALTILLGTPGSVDRARAIQEAAKRPAIFADIMEQYRTQGYPSDDTMRKNLALSTSYIEEAAGRVIASFRETLDLLEQQGIADTSGSGEADGDTDDDERQRTDQNPKKREAAMPDVGQNVMSMDLPIPVIGGGQATLRMPRHMTEQAYTHFVSVLTATLNAWKPAVVIKPSEGDNGAQEEA